MIFKFRRLKKHLNFESVKEDVRKMGVNFASTGIIGIFFQHLIGNRFSFMFWSAFCIAGIGVIFICFGNLWENK